MKLCVWQFGSFEFASISAESGGSHCFPHVISAAQQQLLNSERYVQQLFLFRYIVPFIYPYPYKDKSTVFLSPYSYLIPSISTEFADVFLSPAKAGRRCQGEKGSILFFLL